MAGNDDDIHWYVLNHIGHIPTQNLAQKTVDRFNESEGTQLQLFAPTYVVREERDGKTIMKRLRLAFHYVFLRGHIDDIKRLCSLNNGFSLVLNRSGASRYAIVDNRSMYIFREIARTYENCLPYYSLDDINLDEGDLVEVVNGDFPGLVGTFIPRPKGKTGNIVIRVDNNWGTVAYDIKVSDVRVIRFAPGTTRAYDQIDAIVPHLYSALRLMSANKPLTTSLTSRLTVFARRMSDVRLDNHKLEAKLLAILTAINILLGDMSEADRHYGRFLRRQNSLTNPWTEALTSLILGVTQHDDILLDHGRQVINSLSPSSKAQTLLRDEYLHYFPSESQS